MPGFLAWLSPYVIAEPGRGEPGGALLEPGSEREPRIYGGVADAWIKTRDRTDIYVKDWGDAAARPVVLIHGYPLNSDSLDRTAMKLAEAGIDATARRAHKMITGSQLIEYEGHPHGFYATNSDQMIFDTLAFVRE